MTQVSQILHHLKSGGRITPVEALNKFGCFRLGARIYDLKQAGHPIECDMIEVDTKDGTVRVAEYRMGAKVDLARGEGYGA